MYKRQQEDGKRALCIGYTKEELNPEAEELPNLTMIASIILADPLRKNAKEMLGYFKTPVSYTHLKLINNYT